jgi:hypothetical protein
MREAAKGTGWLLRTPFLWFISFGGAKEPNEVSSVKPNEHLQKKGCPF